MNVVVNKADSSDLRDLVVLTCEFLEDVASQAGMAGFVPDDQKIREKLPEFLDMPDYAVFVARSPKGHFVRFSGCRYRYVKNLMRFWTDCMSDAITGAGRSVVCWLRKPNDLHAHARVNAFRQPCRLFS